MSATTIRKELTTFGTIWGWVVREGLVEEVFPNRGVKYPKLQEKPPFRTWDEIEHQIARGGLTETEQADLWECLFLTLEDVDALLAHVAEHALQPFVYPMVVMAAHTGARRSELLRSRVTDFCDDWVLIHEKKRSKQRTSSRRVPVSRTFREIMKDWIERHPGGQHTFCQMPEVAHSRKRRGEPRPVTPDEANDHFLRTLKGSRWEKLRGWHVLRHSFASNCALKGIDQRIINEWMGHQSAEMERRYRHLFPDAQRQAIDRVFG